MLHLFQNILLILFQLRLRATKQQMVKASMLMRPLYAYGKMFNMLLNLQAGILLHL